MPAASEKIQSSAFESCSTSSPHTKPSSTGDEERCLASAVRHKPMQERTSIANSPSWCGISSAMHASAKPTPEFVERAKFAPIVSPFTCERHVPTKTHSSVAQLKLSNRIQKCAGSKSVFAASCRYATRAKTLLPGVFAVGAPVASRCVPCQRSEARGRLRWVPIAMARSSRSRGSVRCLSVSAERTHKPGVVARVGHEAGGDSESAEASGPVRRGVGGRRALPRLRTQRWRPISPKRAAPNLSSWRAEHRLR